MLVLGIESTAHTFGVGIVKKEGRKKAVVLANALRKFPSRKEGFVPRELADHHAKHAKQVIQEALKQGGVKLAEIGAIAYSYGPGMMPCLRCGFIAAKTLSSFSFKPLIAVNHAVAHIEVGRELLDCQDPLAVYVSGGNTQLIVFDKKERKFHVIGETLDIGIGNLLDNIGRGLELEPPDAVGVMLYAQKHKGKKLPSLPYTVKGMNLAFSGFQTALLKLREKHSKEELAYAAQEYSYSMLVEASERALLHSEKKELLLVGGVAQNPRLQEMLSLVCKEHKVRFCFPPREYCGDNGAMIAIAGLRAFNGRRIEKIPSQDVRVDGEQF